MKPWVAKLLSIVGGGEDGLLGKVLDKVAKDKISQSDKLTIETEYQLALSAQLATEDKNFRDWVLAYEGGALDIPKWVLAIRSTVRPFLTYALAGLWIYCQVMVFNSTDLTPEQTAHFEHWSGLLFKLNILSLGFWYGEKLLTRSGLVDVFKKNGEAK